MILRTATRSAAFIKMFIHGASGSGKTMSSLKIARGLVDDWSQVGIIDTENGSADLYAHLGAYQVITMTPPFHPQSFVQAVALMVNAGIKVIIADSVTHYWDFLKEMHDQVAASSRSSNEWSAWRPVTPLHKQFVECILQTPAHIICCGRAKQEYTQVKEGDKSRIVKLGLRPEVRPGMDYEFTLVFRMENEGNKAFVDKDRTGLFQNALAFTPDETTGQKIREWCNVGDGAVLEDIRQRIFTATNPQQLTDLYNWMPKQLYPQVEAEFTARYGELTAQPVAQ